MILPTKHISISNSLLNVGAAILNCINGEKTITSLWNEVRKLPEVRTFERFTLALDFLFMLGMVNFQDGLLRKIEI